MQATYYDIHSTVYHLEDLIRWNWRRAALREKAQLQSVCCFMDLSIAQLGCRGRVTDSNLHKPRSDNNQWARLTCSAKHCRSKRAETAFIWFEFITDTLDVFEPSLFSVVLFLSCTTAKFVFHIWLARLGVTWSTAPLNLCVCVCVLYVDYCCVCLCVWWRLTQLERADNDNDDIQ